MVKYHEKRQMDGNMGFLCCYTAKGHCFGGQETPSCLKHVGSAALQSRQGNVEHISIATVYCHYSRWRDLTPLPLVICYGLSHVCTCGANPTEACTVAGFYAVRSGLFVIALMTGLSAAITMYEGR